MVFPCPRLRDHIVHVYFYLFVHHVMKQGVVIAPLSSKVGRTCVLQAERHDSVAEEKVPPYLIW